MHPDNASLEVDELFLAGSRVLRWGAGARRGGRRRLEAEAGKHREHVRTYIVIHPYMPSGQGAAAYARSFRSFPAVGREKICKPGCADCPGSCPTDSDIHTVEHSVDD